MLATGYLRAVALPCPKDVLRCPCLLSLRGFRAIENRPQTTRLRKERLVPTTPHGRFGKSGRRKGAVDNVTAHRRSCVVGLQTARVFRCGARGRCDFPSCDASSTSVCVISIALRGLNITFAAGTTFYTTALARTGS